MSLSECENASADRRIKAENKIELTEKQKRQFMEYLKRGVYMELHEREMLTDSQLDILLNQPFFP